MAPTLSYIWNVIKLGAGAGGPMSSGAKSQPLDDVKSVAWNRQMQHIMVATFASRYYDIVFSRHLHCILELCDIMCTIFYNFN